MDKLMYICGLAAGGIALIVGALSFVVYRIKASRLEKKLNSEYGERKKRG